MSAGYSGTPLPKKLGIKEGAAIALLHEPGHAVELLGELPTGARIVRAAGDADVVVHFTRERAVLQAALPALSRAIHPDGAVWVAWPKRSSGVETDMTEDVVRELALPLGLVDNKVCAIDETWSGLRLVWREELRARRA